MNRATGAEFTEYKIKQKTQEITQLSLKNVHHSIPC